MSGPEPRNSDRTIGERDKRALALCGGKRRHETQLSALRAISAMRAKGRIGVLRIYRCNRCRGLHLTSRRAVPRGKGWPVGWA